MFWSSFVQLKFVSRLANGDPDSMSFVVASFWSWVCG